MATLYAAAYYLPPLHPICGSALRFLAIFGITLEQAYLLVSKHTYSLCNCDAEILKALEHFASSSR